MAMSFWEAKRKRRLYTTLYLSIFFVLALAVAYLFEITLRYFAQEGYAPSYPYAGLYLLAFIIFVSGCGCVARREAAMKGWWKDASCSRSTR